MACAPLRRCSVSATRRLLPPLQEGEPADQARSRRPRPSVIRWSVHEPSFLRESCLVFPAFSQFPANMVFHCLSKTSTLCTGWPCAFVPFVTRVMVLPSLETVRVNTVVTLPFCLFVISTV